MNILGQQFQKLFHTMSRLSEPVPEDLPAAIRNLPAAGRLPIPRSTWLLIVLIRYRRRQRSAKKMLLKQLPDRLPVPPDGAGLPEGMPIPGQPVWKIGAHFGPDWGAIRHKVTGEWISVSTSSQDPDKNVVFPYELRNSLRPRSAWSPEARFLKSDTQWLESIDDLVGAGLLRETDSFGAAWDGDDGPPAYVLAPWAISNRKKVLDFCRAWQAPKRRLWLAAAIGDWFTAVELVQNIDDNRLKRAIAERAKEYREFRLAAVRDHLNDFPRDHVALETLQHLAAEDLVEYAERSLQGEEPPWPELEMFLTQIDDPRWCPILYQRFIANCDEKYFNPDVFGWASTLLRHNYRREEVLAALEKFEDGFTGRVLLYMDHAPEKLIPEFRRALRHGRMTRAWPGVEDGDEGPLLTPQDRSIVATMLSIVDRPWSRKELRNALEDLWNLYGNPAEIVRIALALAESIDPETRQYAAPWLALANDEMLRDEQRSMQFLMKDIHERAMKVRRLIEPREETPPTDQPTP